VAVGERPALTYEPVELWHESTEPNRRSVVFLHHCYYNFYYLARALRKRGWDASAVILEPPTNPDLRFAHGADLNLYDPDPRLFRRRLGEFVDHVKRRIRMVHFYGRGRMSFFPEHWDSSERYEKYPLDFVKLRKAGVKIGYSHSGCLDLVSQSSFYRWSGGCCDRCIWQDKPDVCSDTRNLAWGRKVQEYCDLICIETDPVLDFKSGDKVYREPLTFALDPDVWCPDMAVPERWLIPKGKDEVLVYHAMGNVSLRTSDTRNIKGSPAVVAAVERLRGEGHKVRLEFVSDLPSTDVRFIQVQADIIVDQLNYGRYGANAREGMMLGKPTVCFIDAREEVQGAESACLAECPLVSATEATVYDVLKELVLVPERRRVIGEASRAHAVKWWSADACAERYEGVYDRLMSGLPPDSKGLPAINLAQPEGGGESTVPGRLARWLRTLRPVQDQ
jgi:glycosyltransferase involved in cell wall biosynthesis